MFHMGRTFLKASATPFNMIFLNFKEFFSLKEIGKKNMYTYLPTPPLGLDMTQGQFLSGV